MGGNDQTAVASMSLGNMWGPQAASASLLFVSLPSTRVPGKKWFGFLFLLLDFFIFIFLVLRCKTEKEKRREAEAARRKPK